MNKKYELTTETKTIEDGSGNDITLHRIQALRDFNDVKKGDLGGWVEDESNLSQEGNCWVYDNAAVYLNGKVGGDAIISDNVRILQSSSVSGYAKVCDNAMVSTSSHVSDHATISGIVVIYDSSIITSHICSGFRHNEVIIFEAI